MEKVSSKQLSDTESASGNNPCQSRGRTPDWGHDHSEDLVEVGPPKETEAGQTGPNAELFPVASAAHECITPLVAMLGYADLLGNGRLGTLNDKQRQMLNEIQESGRRLRQFLQELLLLYQLQSDGDAVAYCGREVTEVNDALLGIFNYWDPVATRKSIAYQFHPARGNPTVQTGRLELQHIVSNLIENALKYTPASGTVVVSATPCFWERRKTQQTGSLFSFERRVNRRIANSVVIRVNDTGPGIPQEHHEDIFRDFVRLPGASPQGTGLGLAIARRLTLANGGAIWVESQPGRGSSFSLLFAQTR
jgi:signal transduction histidine kinase